MYFDKWPLFLKLPAKLKQAFGLIKSLPKTGNTTCKRYTKQNDHISAVNEGFMH